MKKLLFFLSLSVLLFSCSKDDDDDNNSNPTTKEYFLQYTDGDGNQVRIVGEQDLNQNTEYLLASVYSSFPDGGDSVYTFGGSFAALGGSAVPYGINFNQFFEAGFAGSSQAAGDKFVIEGSYDYADSQLERNTVTITYDLGLDGESTVYGDQSNSTFTVTGVTFTGTAAEPSWDVTGTFECTLYDVDGNETRTFSNGTFRIELIG